MTNKSVGRMRMGWTKVTSPPHVDSARSSHRPLFHKLDLTLWLRRWQSSFILSTGWCRTTVDKAEAPILELDQPMWTLALAAYLRPFHRLARNYFGYGYGAGCLL